MLCSSHYWRMLRPLATGAAFFLIFIALFRSPAPALEGRIDLNSAGAAQLQELPFIGESRARAIIDYRKLHGPFTDINQLLAIEGIGHEALTAVRPYLAINGRTTDIIGNERTAFSRTITTRPGDIVLLPDERYFTTLLELLATARGTVDMTMFLFKTTRSPNNRPALLVKELARARKRGVRVRLLLEHSDYDKSLNKENDKVARALRREGISVTFDSPSTTTHAKFIVVDGRYVLIGSHNLTHSALAFNHEISLLIDSKTLAAELITYMNAIR